MNNYYKQREEEILKSWKFKIIKEYKKTQIDNIVKYSKSRIISHYKNKLSGKHKKELFYHKYSIQLCEKQTKEN